jgi:outer membrane protein OmpA-like peptidoglycan-associated protein
VARIPELENRLATANQERDKLQQDLAQLTEQYTIARIRGEDVNTELARLRKELEDNQQALTDVRRVHDEANRRASQLQGQVEASQQEIARANAEREQTRAQLADLSAQRAALQTELNTTTRLKEEADGHIATLSKDLAAIKNELAQTMSARDTAQTQAKALTEKLTAAQKEIDNVSLARSELEARASNLRQQLSTTTDNVLDLTTETQRLQDQLRNHDLAQLSSLPKTLTKGISFDHRRTTLNEEGKKLLDQAALILQKYPDVQVMIEGYTDSIGDAGFNRLLSEYRANAVRDYLISRGIAPTRLVAAGHGAENAIAPNTTPSGRALNRRIEFHLNQVPSADAAGSPTSTTQGSDKPAQLEFRQPPEKR